ncbi:MAG: hypothetical protein KJ822_02435 [Proteobacteria bacterium]|nr:hypothetical protein [Pseudomonadota bacterium]MBU4354187.1 hypothetical protein [Pseudomonadota bacterium]
MCNTYLRWERGNVRESFVQLSYIFTKYRAKYRLMPLIEFFLGQLEYPLTLVGSIALLLSAMLYPQIILKFIATMGIFSLLNLIYYLWLERETPILT